jgi:hypothetical protein
LSGSLIIPHLAALFFALRAFLRQLPRHFQSKGKALKIWG